MTKTEAIKQLQNCIDLIKQDGQDYLDDRDIPLLNTAIEALKAEPTHCRLIDADALILLLKARKQFFIDSYGGSFHTMSEKDKARCDEIDACIASIVNAPTVTVVDITQRDLCEDINCEDCPFMQETCKLMDCVAYADRPHGEWISNHDGSWNCSECGLRVFIYAKGNYCPNCGYDMRGDDN